MPSNLPIAAIRQHFAEEVMLQAGLHNPGLLDALASVPRETFMGPGPWLVAHTGHPIPHQYRYTPTPDDDPRWLYHNVTLALDASLSLVTAQPTAVAECLHTLQLAPEQSVLHLGAGVGYYTAIMAHMVGPKGRVVATEVHPELGERARQHLADQPHVQVHVGADLPETARGLDAMFINTGISHVLPDWLDRLAPGGRLLAPLTMALDAHVSAGLWLSLQHHPDGTWPAEVLLPALGYTGVGIRHPIMEALLRQAMTTGQIHQVKRVRRDTHAPEASCILHHAGACLSR